VRKALFAAILLDSCGDEPREPGVDGYCFKGEGDRSAPTEMFEYMEQRPTILAAGERD
jgi:hypothetical protein